LPPTTRFLIYYQFEVLTITFKKYTEMENNKEEIEKLVIKLKVLENRIHYLETLTDEVLNELETAYHEQIRELRQKKEEAQQTLLKIEEAKDFG